MIDTLAPSSVDQFIPCIFEEINSEFIKLKDEIFSKNPNLTEKEPEHSYILLALKVFHNLQSTEILALNGSFPDIGIISRSAFESLILLKLFISFPEELEIWKIESEIVDFRNNFILHKYYPKTKTVEDLMACYQILSPEAQKSVGLESSIKINNLLIYKKDKLEQKLQSYKTKYCREINSTNIRRLIEKIIEKDPDFVVFERLHLFLYDRPSQLGHSIHGSILYEYISILTSFEEYKLAFQDFYRWYALLSTQVITTLKQQSFMQNININPYFQSLRKGGILLKVFETTTASNGMTNSELWQFHEELLRKV